MLSILRLRFGTGWATGSSADDQKFLIKFKFTAFFCEIKPSTSKYLINSKFSN